MIKSLININLIDVQNNIVINKLFHGEKLTVDDFFLILNSWEDEGVREKIKFKALSLREIHHGKKVYSRGLIEFSNYCRNDCYYCGIRCGNKKLERYRLSKDEIMNCVDEGYNIGYRTFVLQSGEDLSYTDDILTDIISSIKEKYPDTILTLSVGEKNFDTYKAYKDAGADRFLLREEAANEKYFSKLHPENQKLKSRLECHKYLMKLGYDVGAGFMVGAPGQTLRNIAEDLFYFQELQPRMVGIGPFIPHRDTVYRDEKPGSVELTLFLISLIRVMIPDILLPATTALNTLAKDGHKLGILAGANVIMPNLSPKRVRKLYSLYDNKKIGENESAQQLKDIEKCINGIGYMLDNSM